MRELIEKLRDMSFDIQITIDEDRWTIDVRSADISNRVFGDDPVKLLKELITLYTVEDLDRNIENTADER